ncbi:DNA-directed DNA polymerase [Myotisia sp. PD_48]|nr:DNA-directed DNA polymerase [Myotisia sp. PD_48]
MVFSNPKKRRRETANVDVKLVEIYDDLSNENDEIRLKAAKDLLLRFSPDGNATDEEIEKVLQRLFRGLCSSRKAARVGFSIALTELLSLAFTERNKGNSESTLNVPKILDILEAHTNTTSSNAGQEERDHHFGRLFGAEAILKSSILLQPDIQPDNWSRMLTLVFELANKKPWLREECGYIVFCAIRDIKANKSLSKYVETALTLLCKNNLARTPEGIAIWLAAMSLSLSPSVVFPQDVWIQDNPLNVREKAAFAKIMKESSSPSSSEGEEGTTDGKKQKSGIWNPKLHFAWDYILATLFAAPLERSKSESKSKKDKSSQVTFAEFWTEVVDCGLFAAASSEERKYWGFLAVNKILNEGPLPAASLIFTKNFMRCFMNQLAVEDRYLHRMAVKVSKSIQARTSKEPEFVNPALRALLGPGGAINFDQITKTKTVEKMLHDIPPSALEQLLPFFESLIVNSDDDEKASTLRRQQLANILQTIVKSQTAAAKDNNSEELDSIVEKVILLLARYTYFAPGQNSELVPKPAINETTREFFRNKIMSFLNTIITGRKQPSNVAYYVVNKIHKMERDGDQVGHFIIEMTDSITESVQSAFKILKKIDRKERHSDQAQDPSIPALKLLYSLTVLQVYNGDTEAVSMLDELKLCYDKFFGRKHSDNEEGTQASDALVEMLLSFASKPSQLFRRMSEQVFGAFANKLTITGLESLLSILATKESLAGQQELFDNQDDEGGEENEEDSDVEMIDGSDVEVVNAGSESESSNEEDEDDEDDENLAEFDAKLAAALGTHRADKDLDAASSDSDSDMDDEQMEALDDQLVKVFQAREQASTSKKTKKDARETMINFKNRVLDLLEIYVKKCHSNSLCLEIIVPLLQLIRKTSVQQLSGKATAVLREYTKLCKSTAIPSVESAEPVWELLKYVHEEATHSSSNSHGSSCSQTSILLVKVLVAHDKGSISGIVDMYADTRKKQLSSNKCHVQPTFFSDWNNWCISASKQLKN